MSDAVKKIKKIVVDRNLCIGAGPCVFAAGTVFELDGQRKAVMKKKAGPSDSGPVDKEALADQAITDDAIIAAAQSCPVRAILLYDDKGEAMNV